MLWQGEELHAFQQGVSMTCSLNKQAMCQLGVHVQRNDIVCIVIMREKCPEKFLLMANLLDKFLASVVYTKVSHVGMLNTHAAWKSHLCLVCGSPLLQQS